MQQDIKELCIHLLNVLVAIVVKIGIEKLSPIGLILYNSVF